MNKTTILFVVIWNIIVFFIYYVDKLAAIKGTRRVPESNLIAMALCFGSLGAFLGMKIFHHKTQHSKFMVLIPIFFVIHLIVIYCMLRSSNYI